MLNWILKKVIDKDFVLILVYTVWLIASLCLFDDLNKRLTAANFGHNGSLLIGAILAIAALAPYVLLTLQMFSTSKKAEFGKSGISRATIALFFMLYCSSIIVLIWSLKNNQYYSYVLNWINEPNFYTLGGVAIFSFWVSQSFYDSIYSYEFSLSSIGMVLAIVCHLFFLYIYFNDVGRCVDGVCDRIHIGVQITVFSIVSILVILGSYIVRDWLRVRSADFHPNEGNKIIQDFGQHIIDYPRAEEIFDVTMLPHQKVKILNALCWAISLSSNNKERQDQLSAAAIMLASYQKDVGQKPIYLAVSGEEGERWRRFNSLVEKDIEAISDIINAAKNKYSMDL